MDDSFVFNDMDETNVNPSNTHHKFIGHKLIVKYKAISRGVRNNTVYKNEIPCK